MFPQQHTFEGRSPEKHNVLYVTSLGITKRRHSEVCTFEERSDEKQTFTNVR